MLRTRVLLAGIGGSLVLAVAPSFAATILGTSQDDTLRGTPRADRLYGRAGNDTLVGRGGNDLLVGGPGADRLLCGSGRDVARADLEDRVARDCELVKGLPPATTGTYCGVTSQDMSICLDVERGGFGVWVVSGIRLTVQTSCDPPLPASFDYGLQTIAAIQSNRSFASNVSVPGVSAVVQGSFAVSRTSVAGTLRVQAQENRAGVAYTCDSGEVDWSAETPPPDPSAQIGRYCGATDQGLALCFEVEAPPKTVTDLELRVRPMCAPPGPAGVLSTIPTSYAIRADSSFRLTRTGTGTSASGAPFTITHRMSGSFDAGGTWATGTLSAHVEYQTAEGASTECDSGTIAWTTQRQQSG